MSTALSFQDHQHVFCNLMLNHINGDKAASWFDPKAGLCHNFQIYLRSEGNDIFNYYDEANNGQLYKNAKRLGYLIKYAK